MTTQALLLNADFTPLKVISWERAITMLLDETAEIVETYKSLAIRTVSNAYDWPAVLRLLSYHKPRARVRFNRRNVLARDGFRCAYCGVAPKTKAGAPDVERLTIDHVIPRAQSRDGRVRLKSGKIVSITCWENVVCACETCNVTKADRTPEQAKMKLAHEPRVPTMGDVLLMSLRRFDVPEEWKSYLPDTASEWAEYWDSELESD